MQALEAFVARSPQEAEPLVSSIFEETLKCLAYDPNFTDDMEEDEEEEEDEDADGYSVFSSIHLWACIFLSYILSCLYNTLAVGHTNDFCKLLLRFS